MSTEKNDPIWLLPGLRTPFAKADGAYADQDVVSLSVPVVQAMNSQLKNGGGPDLAVWGTVAPNLRVSNIARDVWLDAGLNPEVPSFSTSLACSTSMVAVFEAASMLRSGVRDVALAGGVESMSRVEVGLSRGLSDWLKRVLSARSLTARLAAIASLRFRDLRLHIPSIVNRVTGKSMGEHTEEMAKTWSIARADQDVVAFDSHRNAVAARERGFFDSLVVPFGGLDHDAIPREDTSAEKLAKLSPVFDRTSGQGTLTAGNSSPLTDGAAGVWVSTNEGLDRLPADMPRVKLVDWEIAAVDIQKEGLLMAPAYAIPRLLARNELRYDDVGLWELHEAFAAQVLANIAAIESETFVTETVGVPHNFGAFPRERLNPNGGSVALGHPFGATGARILSQAVKELATKPSGTRAVVSICADGGLGTVALLEAA